MPLAKGYASQNCSIARALEIVGERWTLLIVRDAFFGVRRFGDFVEHLGVPRAVLSERLAALVDAHVLRKVEGPHGRDEYELTPVGIDLFPVVRSLQTWGEEHRSPRGPQRVMRHVDDDAPVEPSGRCTGCDRHVEPADLLVAPGPGLRRPSRDDDGVTQALRAPHRLLTPLFA